MKSKRLDIIPGDLVQIRVGKNAGKVVEVVSILYRDYGEKWRENPTLTYCVKEINRNVAFYALGSSLKIVRPAPDPE